MLSTNIDVSNRNFMIDSLCCGLDKTSPKRLGWMTSANENISIGLVYAICGWFLLKMVQLTLKTNVTKHRIYNLLRLKVKLLRLSLNNVYFFADVTLTRRQRPARLNISVSIGAPADYGKYIKKMSV